MDPYKWPSFAFAADMENENETGNGLASSFLVARIGTGRGMETALFNGRRVRAVTQEMFAFFCSAFFATLFLLLHASPTIE